MLLLLLHYNNVFLTTLGWIIAALRVEEIEYPEKGEGEEQENRRAGFGCLGLLGPVHLVEASASRQLVKAAVGVAERGHQHLGEGVPNF